METAYRNLQSAKETFSRNSSERHRNMLRDLNRLQKQSNDIKDDIDSAFRDIDNTLNELLASFA